MGVEKTCRRLVVFGTLALFPTAGSSPAVEPAPDPAIDIVAKGLDTPWSIDFAADGRAFITERPGRVRVIEKGRLLPEPWITLDVASSSEAGLLGLALDRRFPQDPFVYVAYTYRDLSGKMQNRLARLREDPQSHKGKIDMVLIDHVAGANNHDGGRVKFGPDGKLYWTTGDAQATRHSQNLKSLNGKILRVNSDGLVPADNPFPNSYVYSYGHRNPQGLAWQPDIERLYSTEHGPSGFQGCCRDEVNLIEAGKNYGWPEVRGDETREGMVAPVIHAGISETWAPSGAAFVTRGPWAGSLVFAGLRGQTLYRVRLDPRDPRKVQSFGRHYSRQFGRLRDVVEGPDGNLYLLTSNRDGRGSPINDDDRILRVRFR